MIGQRFLAPVSVSDYVEGVVTEFEEETGKVTLITEDNEIYQGYEYQLEPVEE